MELKNLITKERIISTEYPDPELEGFVIDIAYVPREELQKIRQKCLVTKFDKKTRQPTESVDDKLFLKLYTEKVLRGWKGLKLKYLKELLPVDLGSANPEMELEFTVENALELMQNSTVFDTWLTGVINDISFFNKNS